jgi:alpha-1,6-mannosyltransferase
MTASIPITTARMTRLPELRLTLVDVTSFFSAANGGIKSYYRAKARFLPPLGVRCHFVVPAERDGEKPFAGGTLHEVAGPLIPGSRHYRFFPGIRRLRAILEALAPDVIEVGSHYLLPRLIAQIVRGLPKAPALVGFYHADFPRTYVGPLLARAPEPLRRRVTASAWWLVRRQHARYATTLAASRHTAQALEAAGVPRVRWVGLGVDTELFCPLPQLPTRARPQVLYAGRLAVEKEVALLLAAWDRVHARTGAELILAGDGPLAGELAAWAARRPAVRWLGYVDGPADVAALLADADVVVAPGARESFSLVAAEALACGTPVIGADAGGNGELLADSGGGLPFRAGDAGALAETLTRALALLPEERRALGRRGRAHVLSSLTWTAVCQRLLSAYRAVA